MGITEPQVDLGLALKHGLSEIEYARIMEILGRVPTYTELGVFSVMWSEHCSYKSSIAELKKLPRTGDRLLVSAGEENAGLVDIGDGLAVAFKIESHNHPSAVEPYQGAATGVGGIMRDIFTMGARPIAALDSLRFGRLENPRTQYLLKGVVRGIGDYGNSFGVPTVGGEVYFEDCYQDNPLVNCMAVGIVEKSNITRSIARGQGSLVMIAGSKTGRDGIHGATFASEDLSEDSHTRRPSVQVGDPFTEKLLLEATLEVIKEKLVIGIQDMGAAGITCSTAEMSAKGKSGMVIDIDLVPTRERNMTPYEIMLSESQERMLLVVPPENEGRVREIFEKWDLLCNAIGRVTDDGKLRVQQKGSVVADIPAESLVLGGGAPVYQPDSQPPGYIKEIRQLDVTKLPEPVDYNACLKQLLASPSICSREWIYTQYDTMVRTNTMDRMGCDASVVLIKGTSRALALTTDCNPTYVYLNPYIGAQIAVAEAARNVVCVGARPLAITNCLNFGNPGNPEVYWQFKEAVRGIGDACRALRTPVTGGNVSFYNESGGRPIYPTPVIGMLGEIQDIAKRVTCGFKAPGDVIMLLGSTKGHLGGSTYLKVLLGKVQGDAPPINLVAEHNIQNALLQAIDEGLIKSAHDLSEGGLGVALAESCLAETREDREIGVWVDIGRVTRPDQFLFGEDQSRILISSNPENVPAIEGIMKTFGVPVQTIGEVIKDGFFIEKLINLDLDEMALVYYESIERGLEVEV